MHVSFFKKNGPVFSRVALWCFVCLALVYLLMPQFIVIPLSFSEQNYLSFPPSGWSMKWYQSVAGNPAWQRAAFNSFAIGIPTAILSMIIGTLAALAISRGNIRAVAAISALMVAPLMLPHIILAIGLYPTMLRMGLLGTYPAAIIGHTVIGAPLVFITVTSTLSRYPASLESAAMTLGARPLGVFWRITFPLIRTGIFVGGTLAFASSFDELMLSLFLTSVGTTTLPRLIWEQLNDYLTPAIAAVASLIFLLTLIVLLAAAIMQIQSGSARVSSHGGEH